MEMTDMDVTVTKVAEHGGNVLIPANLTTRIAYGRSRNPVGVTFGVNRVLVADSLSSS
jgi:hypothetical protein